MNPMNDLEVQWQQTEKDLQVEVEAIKALQWAETKTKPIDPKALKEVRARCVAIANRRIEINLKRNALLKIQHA